MFVSPAECGYCAHIKCLNQITRTCASVRVKVDPTYCLSICEDRGLSNQNYRCAECRGQISYSKYSPSLVRFRYTDIVDLTVMDYMVNRLVVLRLQIGIIVLF